jgi:hypothetical protein
MTRMGVTVLQGDDLTAPSLDGPRIRTLPHAYPVAGLAFVVAAIGLMSDSSAHAAEGLMSGGQLRAPSREGAILAGGIRVVATPAEYGYIDRRGKALPLPKANYRHLCRFHNGLAVVEIVNPGDESWGPQHWGFVNAQGQLAVPPKFQYADDFHEGLAAVNVGGKPYGGADPVPRDPMLDADGRHFVHPVAGGKWGYIDVSGKWAIGPRFSAAGDFADGRAEVELRKTKYVVDASGKLFDVDPR